ncbi:hypothetical protein [Nostoc sp. LEGE 12450]|nr:hypothetical protein [Nostoc sp. LEGE 12450]
MGIKVVTVVTLAPRIVLGKTVAPAIATNILLKRKDLRLEVGS